MFRKVGVITLVATLLLTKVGVKADTINEKINSVTSQNIKYVTNAEELRDALIDNNITNIELKNSIEFNYIVTFEDLGNDKKYINGNGNEIFNKTGYGKVSTDNVENLKINNVTLWCNKSKNISMISSDFFCKVYGTKIEANNTPWVVISGKIEDSSFTNSYVVLNSNAYLKNVNINGEYKILNSENLIDIESKNITFEDVNISYDGNYGVKLTFDGELTFKGKNTFDGTKVAAITNNPDTKYYQLLNLSGQVYQKGDGYTILNRRAKINVIGKLVGFKSGTSTYGDYTTNPDTAYNTKFRIAGTERVIKNQEIIGDVNNDKKLDIMDISTIASKYNFNEGDSLWNSKYDLNIDKVIDIYDLVDIAKEV